MRNVIGSKARASLLRITASDERGVTLIELTVAVAIVGILLLASLSITTSVVKSANEARDKLYSSMDRDLGLRWLIPAISASDLLRAKNDGASLISCSSGLDTTEATVTVPARVFENDGDGFNFAFSAYRSMGSSSRTSPDTLLVPNPQLFRPGHFVMLTSLDAARLNAVYRVVSANAGTGEVLLNPSLGSLPDGLPCTVTNSIDATAFLNPSETRKYLVSVVQFARVQVSADARDGSLALVARNWRRFGDGSTEVSEFPLLQNVRSLRLTQKFVSTTESKGRYEAGIEVRYVENRARPKGEEPEEKSLGLNAGFNLAGVEIANEAAVPEPPSLEFMDVTCSLSFATSYSDYAAEATGETIPIQKISIMMTDEARVKAAGPTTTITLADLETGDPVRCWNYNKVKASTDFNMAGSLLEGDGSVFQPEFTLATIDGIPSFQSLYCNNSGKTQAQVTLKFSDPTAGGAVRTISCSPAVFERTKTRWVYAAETSTCAADGSIALGRLVSAADSGLAGPVLTVRDDGCRWSGTSKTSCNPFEILNETPGARLQEIQLQPSTIEIGGQAAGNKVKCL